MSWSRLKGLTLENHAVVLRPLTREDWAGLQAIAYDPDIWRYFVFRIENEQDLRRFLDEAVADNETGKRAVFGVHDRATNELAGSMAFGNLSEAERRLEIGWSWLGAGFRGTTINGWSKYLLLQDAFEALDCERVEFKTDVLNLRARAGLRKIGATEEGTLRSYNYMPDGRRRDAIYYSVLRREWPEVKDRLASRLMHSRP